MSNHTKAPWMFDGKVVYALNKKGVNVFSAFVQDGETDEDELKANARRIVACVNACEGISTENLEDNLPVKDLARQYSEAIRQRDELLAALEKAAAVFRAYSELHDSKGATEKAISNMQHAMSCEEAIASVKGGAA